MALSDNRLDRYYSVLLDVSISTVVPGEIAVFGSGKRGDLKSGERDVVVFWLLCTNGRYVISAHPDIVAPLRDYVAHIVNADELMRHRHDDALLTICKPVLPSGVELSLSGISPKYTCDSVDRRFLDNPHVRALAWEDLPVVWQYLRDSGIALTEVRKGTTYVYYHDEQPVACSGAVPLKQLSDELVEVGMALTLETMRRRGFATAVVAAATNAVLAEGRTPLYSTQEKNIASQRTALAVGYREYGRMFMVRYRSAS